MDENIVYEERENEFDIVSIPYMACLQFSHTSNQEDEEVIAARKRKEEEEPVDIDGSDGTTNSSDQNGIIDEDLTWADEEPDEDRNDFKLKTVVRDGYDI